MCVFQEEKTSYHKKDFENNRGCEVHKLASKHRSSSLGTTKLIVAFPHYAKASKNGNKSKLPHILPHLLGINMPSNKAETNKQSESYDIWDITENKVMGWATEKLSFDMRKWLPFLQNTQTECWAYPISCWSIPGKGMGPLSSKVKWPMHEADNSFPSSAQVNNAWNYASTSAYISGF